MIDLIVTVTGYEELEEILRQAGETMAEVARVANQVRLEAETE